jgi:glutamate/tyrosine decarboxylase-like PLP-dependent enzyme
VKFCALKLKVTIRSWSLLLLVRTGFVLRKFQNCNLCYEIGTTVLGAFDPLEKIADLCEKYKMWMHVDAAWGGGALMSQKYKKLLKGIER